MGDVLAIRTWRAHSAAGELDTDGTSTCAGIVWSLVQPDQITDPAHVAITGHTTLCQPKWPRPYLILTQYYW